MATDLYTAASVAERPGAGGAAHAPAPLRALILSNLPTPPAGGGSAESGPDPLLLARGLQALGIEMATVPLLSYPWNPLARRGTFYAGFDVLRTLRTLVAGRRADVIVSVGESNVYLLLRLARLAGFQVPVVLREISGPGWRRRDRIVEAVVPRADRVMLLSPRQVAWARDRFGPELQADMVGFAIDEQFFAPIERTEQNVVLAVGDDVGRDYPCLLEAFRALPGSTRLLIRASAATPVPPEMRARVDILGRQDFVALRDLYAAAAVVAVPLRPVEHPSGITSLFEAMAMGRAVVCSDSWAADGVVEHGRNGWIVPPGDPAALRDAIGRLLADAALRRRLGQAARATIESRHSYRAYVERFAASLRAAVGARSRPRRQAR